MSAVDLCLRFYATFSPLEVEIISHLYDRKEHSYIGTYSGFTEELNRDKSVYGDVSNIRKVIVRLADKNFITNDEVEVMIDGINRSYRKFHKIKLVDNFVDLLANQDFTIQQIRYKKRKSQP